jgi:hypothetical protein
MNSKFLANLGETLVQVGAAFSIFLLLVVITGAIVWLYTPVGMY